MHGIDAVGRHDPAGDFHIRCWKSQLASELVAFDGSSLQRVGPSEHLTGGVEFTLLNGRSDTGAADGLAIERDGSESVNGEILLHAKRFEKVDIAASLAAKGEIAADADAADMAKTGDELLDELFSGFLAERLVEMDQQQSVDAEGFNDAKPLIQ